MSIGFKKWGVGALIAMSVSLACAAKTKEGPSTDATSALIQQEGRNRVLERGRERDGRNVDEEAKRRRQASDDRRSAEAVRGRDPAREGELRDAANARLIADRLGGKILQDLFENSPKWDALTERERASLTVFAES